MARRTGPVDHTTITDGARVQHHTWTHPAGGPQRGTVIVRHPHKDQQFREVSWDGSPTVTRLDADLAAELARIY